MTDFDVLGIGNALVDVLAQISDEQLAQLELEKGSMTLVDPARAAAIYGAIGPTIESSGGSAANTIVGIAQGGHSAAFVGRVCADELGAVFAHDLAACGVSFLGAPAADGPPTGRCYVLVTPDGERTMATSLGASSHFAIRDLEAIDFTGIAFLYLEGYLWDLDDAKHAFRTAARRARAAGAKVVFTLSDRFCVERHHVEFEDFISEHVDILFANIDEASAMVGSTDLDAIAIGMAQLVSHVVVTRSADGCMIVEGTEVAYFPAVPVAAVIDTTGAGDAFAAGYLGALLAELGPAERAMRGSAQASRVITHLGARELAGTPRTS